MSLRSRLNDIGNVFFIVAENGVVLPEPRDEDEAVGAVPPGLVVGGVGGVAAGCVVHDEEPAELIKRGAHAAEVGRVVDRIEGGLVCLFGAIHGRSFHNGRLTPARRGAGQPLRHDLGRAECFLRQNGLGILCILGGFPHQSAEFRHAAEPEEPGLVNEVHKMACVAVIRGFLPDGEHVPVFAGSVFKGHLTHSPVDHREGLRVMPVFGSKCFPAGLRVLVQRAAGVREHRGHPEPAGLQQCREPERPGRGGGVDRDIPAGQRFGSLRQRLFGFVFVGVQQSCTDDGCQPDALSGTGGVDRRRDLLQHRPLGSVDLLEVPAVRHFQERSSEPLFQVFAGRLPKGVRVDIQ